MPTQRKGIRSQAELGTTIVKGLRIHFHHHHLVFYHYRSDRNAKPPIKMLCSRRGFIAKRCVILQFCWSRSRQCSVRLSEIHLTLKLLQEKLVRVEGTEPEPKKKSKRKRMCWASTQTKRVSKCESKSKTACSWRSSSSGRANIEELKTRLRRESMDVWANQIKENVLWRGAKGLQEKLRFLLSWWKLIGWLRFYSDEINHGRSKRKTVILSVDSK